MILSPTSAIEKTLRIALDEAKSTIDEITGVWSQTAKRSLDVIKRSTNGEYSFKSYQDSNGTTHHALIGTANSDPWNFGYADVKMMTCAIGDLFNASMIAPLKVIDTLDSAMKRLEDLINRYIGRWTKDVTNYVKETLKDLMYWKVFYCWGDKVIKWLNELNSNYGGKTIEEFSPFLTDFCILAKECPLLKEYVLDTPYMKNLAVRINRASDKFDNWMSQTKAQAEIGISDYFQAHGGDKVSNWVGDVTDFYRQAKAGVDPVTQGLSNMNQRADIRNLQAQLNTATDPATKASIQSQIDTAQANLNSENKTNSDIRNNIQKYVSSVLTLDDIRKRAENTSIGYTPDQLSNGIPIGLNGKAQVSFDENGKAQSISYIDATGNVCQTSPFDLSTYEPSDDMSKILERLCNFTLGDLFKNVLDMIKNVMSTISTVVDTTVNTLGRWLKAGISFVKKMIITPFLNQLSKAIPLGDTVIKIMNFYKDWLKCQALFCPSPFTDKLVKLGKRLLNQFRANIRYESVPRIDSEGKPMVDLNGNPIMRKVYYYALDELLSSRLIDPFINGITGLIDATAFAVKTVAKGCDSNSTGQGNTDLKSKTVSRWDTQFKPIVDKIDDLIYTLIDPSDIVRCVRASDPNDEYLIRAGLTGTWFDDNEDDLKELYSKIPNDTDDQAVLEKMNSWKSISGDINYASLKSARESAKNYEVLADIGTEDAFQKLVLSGAVHSIIEQAIQNGNSKLVGKDLSDKISQYIQQAFPSDLSYSKVSDNIKNLKTVLSGLNFPETVSINGKEVNTDSYLLEVSNTYFARMEKCSKIVIALMDSVESGDSAEVQSLLGYTKDQADALVIKFKQLGSVVKSKTDDVDSSNLEIVNLMDEFVTGVLPKTMGHIAESLGPKQEQLATTGNYIGEQTMYETLMEDASKLVEHFVGLGDSFRVKLAEGLVFKAGNWVPLEELLNGELSYTILQCGDQKIIDDYKSVIFIENRKIADSFLSFAYYSMTKAVIGFRSFSMSSQSFQTTSTQSSVSSLEQQVRLDELTRSMSVDYKSDQQVQKDLQNEFNKNAGANLDSKSVGSNGVVLDNVTVKGGVLDGFAIVSNTALMDTKTNSKVTLTNENVKKISLMRMGIDLRPLAVPDKPNVEGLTPIQEMKKILQ